MLWARIIWLFILFILGRHVCFPTSPRYMELADSADFFIERENWPKAEEKIIQALRIEPANFTNSLLLANLGLVQTSMGEYEKALQSLTLGLNIAPRSTVILNNRAHTYILVDDIEKAEADLDKSLEIDSLQEWPLQTRAFLYLQKSDFENAGQIFDKMMSNFPENPSVYTGKATIAEALGNTEEALAFYSKALSLDPTDDETREAYIFLIIKQENYSEARSKLREALEINPENPMFYLLRGYLHRLNFRPDEALADKKIAISKGLDPKLVSDFIP